MVSSVKGEFVREEKSVTEKRWEKVKNVDFWVLDRANRIKHASFVRALFRHSQEPTPIEVSVLFVQFTKFY